jgi:uncharacterized protein (TIGR00255 family)
MIFSMTGYGVANRADRDLGLTVELRAVNNRYLKVSYRTPDFLTALEPEFERRIRGRISRGAVTLTVQCQLIGPLVRPPLNEAVLEGYVVELRRIATKFGLRTDLGVADLAALPGVFDEHGLHVDLGPIRERVLATVEVAIEDFQAMRRQEGKALEADLREHAAAIRRHLVEVRRLAPSVVEEYRDRLLERVKVLLKEQPVDAAQQTLLAEVSLYAERSDISEELARLDSHLGQFDEFLASDQPTGRKLEFLAQEILREATTVGAKAGHPEISRRVVEVKAAVDRIKEQVQNAE